MNIIRFNYLLLYEEVDNRLPLCVFAQDWIHPDDRMRLENFCLEKLGECIIDVDPAIAFDGDDVLFNTDGAWFTDDEENIRIKTVEHAEKVLLYAKLIGLSYSMTNPFD